MCGICGIFTFNRFGEPEGTSTQVRDMMDLMTHRGPDDEGFWMDEYCAFGFRRLSILDLSSAGHQPIISGEGRFVLIFNGEVYNFVEIREQLEQLGTRFSSTGDAEVVLYAIARWGIPALSKFNGMFALAFYDNVENTLLLARDHAGIKPLYYLLAKEGLVFGSQYNQVLRHPLATGRGISQAALGMYLRFGHTPAPYGLVDGTHLMEPGSWLKLDRGGKIRQGRFYELPDLVQPELRGRKAFEAFDDAFSRAVKRHLISDVPVGLFLSGGIDSPLVAAEAVRHSGSVLKAFTIGVEDPEMDERIDAAQYARELGLDHLTQNVGGAAALELLDDVVNACTEPTADFSIFPTMLVSRLASQHVKVVLSGDGGDELFWGYPSRFGTVLEQARYYDYPLAFRYGSIFARKYLGRGYATRDVLWSSVGRLYQKKHTIFLENDLKNLFPGLAELPADFDLFDFQETEPDVLAQKLRWNEFNLHLANILSKVDRASMYHSLEVRVPLLDKEVIEIATKIDWTTCFDPHSRVGKIPLRQALKMRMQHHTTTKKGFTVPMHDWLSGPLQPLLREKVLGRKDFLGQPVNQPHLKKLNQSLIVGDSTPAWGLWLLLSLALWQENHLACQGRK